MRRLLAVAIVSGLVGACGVQADGEPKAIAARDLPADLIDPDPGSSTSLPESGATSLPVYLLEETGDNGVRLVARDRGVTEAGTPNEALAALFMGASSEETGDGLSSAIPADTVLRDVATDTEAREVTVDLSEDFFSIEGEALAQAFAQIVWTATEPDAGGFRQVRFLVDGEPTAAFLPDGTEDDGPVTRASYNDLSPVPLE